MKSAAVSSLLLAGLLAVVFPSLLAAAGYLGLLVGAAAATALAGGLWLWHHDSILARTAVCLAAVATAAGETLLLVPGLPGAQDPHLPSPLAAAGGLVLCGAVVLSLAVDVTRRRPVPAPDHPYAL